jgi:hypothetical protein
MGASKNLVFIASSLFLLLNEKEIGMFLETRMFYCIDAGFLLFLSKETKKQNEHVR